MKDAMKQMPALLERIKKHGFVLMLDFDGVLSPIVERPSAARIPARTKMLLAACAGRGQVAVISGRSLSDVRKRVGLANIWYSGNHGAEWLMGNKRGHENLSSVARTQLRSAYTAFVALSRRYRGVFIEDKKLTFSVHFRGLSRTNLVPFKKDVRALAAGFKRMLDIGGGNEYVYNVRLRTGHTKGFAVRLARKIAPPKAVALYIGDDTTDEDAFRALPRGITIRVGKFRGSAARYFVRSRADVDTILSSLART